MQGTVPTAANGAFAAWRYSRRRQPPHGTLVTDSPSHPLQTDALPEDAPYLAATTRWLEKAVIGLNLCPFARAPHVQQRLRMRVSHARDTDGLLDDLLGELQSLNAAAPEDCETTLLIHPHVLGDFLDYNAFLDTADMTVETRSTSSPTAGSTISRTSATARPIPPCTCFARPAWNAPPRR
jgi:hypothetical protein